MEEPPIIVNHREELAELLTEAVEVEHNLMCCYLFAAWSLKRGAQDGLTEDQTELVDGWRDAVIGIAIDEMAHLANARQPAGRHRRTVPTWDARTFLCPLDSILPGSWSSCWRFDRDTVDHFVYLERPEGVQLEDGAAFAHEHTYQRVIHADLLMPTAS